MNLRPGMRLRSQVCVTQVVVVRAPTEDADLTCGGHPMIDIKAEPTPGLVLKESLDEGSPLGKRFVNDEGDLEVLVTKGGLGTLAISTSPLIIKQAELLPSSD